MERHQERPNPGIDRCVRSGGVLCLPAAGWYWLWVRRLVYTPCTALVVAVCPPKAVVALVVTDAGWGAGVYWGCVWGDCSVVVVVVLPLFFSLVGLLRDVTERYEFVIL